MALAWREMGWHHGGVWEGHVHMCVHVCVFVHGGVCACLHVHRCVSAWMHVCMFVDVCMYGCVCACLCMCVCICKYMCACVRARGHVCARLHAYVHVCTPVHVPMCTYAHKIVHVGTFIDTKFCVQLHSCACTSTRMCSHSCACPAGCALCICTHLWGGQGVLQSCSAPFGHGVLKHVCLCEKRQQIFLSAAAGKGCQYCRRSTRHQRGTASHSAFSHFTISAFSIITLCL